MNKLVCISACTGSAVDNLKKTVLEFVDNHVLLKYLDEQMHGDIINVLKGSSRIGVWACRSSVKNQLLWSRLNINDTALFYSDLKFVAYGEIIGLLDSPIIGKELWDNDKFRYIIIFDKIKRINISRNKFWSNFHYSDKARIQGLQTPNLKIQSELFCNDKSIYEQVLEVLL